MKKADRIAHSHLEDAGQAIPPLAALVAQNGPIPLPRPRGGDLFQSLARTLVGQQLSAAAARTIWGRIEAAGQPHGGVRAMLAQSAPEDLRPHGLSLAKAKALVALHNDFDARGLPGKLLPKRPAEELMAEITALRGFGPWSAEMVIMFELGHADIWSNGDGSLQRGMALLRKQMRRAPPADKIVRACAPYRSLLALHIWRGLDSGVLT